MVEGYAIEAWIILKKSSFQGEISSNYLKKLVISTILAWEVVDAHKALK